MLETLTGFLNVKPELVLWSVILTFGARPENSTDLPLDVHLGISISKATTFDLCTMFAAVTGFLRDEGTWDNVTEAIPL